MFYPKNPPMTNADVETGSSPSSSSGGETCPPRRPILTRRTILGLSDDILRNIQECLGAFRLSDVRGDILEHELRTQLALEAPRNPEVTYEEARAARANPTDHERTGGSSSSAGGEPASSEEPTEGTGGSSSSESARAARAVATAAIVARDMKSVLNLEQ